MKRNKSKSDRDVPSSDGHLSASDADGRYITRSSHTPLGARFSRSQSDLSSTRQHLLRRILEESNETFFLSSREMGKRYDVDPATIIRTIQALGYEKFADFANDLREHFVTKITPYHAMKAAVETEQSVADRIRQSVDKDLANLNGFRTDLNADQIIDVANRISLARRVTVVGVDFAASLASLLSYGLLRLGIDIDAPVGSSGVMQNRMKIMTPKDLLIAISFGRGLRETIETVKAARRRNIPSIGITDGDTTPIAKYCDMYIVASTARSSFIDSYVAPTAALNAILVACAHSQSERSLEHLRQFEDEYFSSTRWYQEP